MAESCELCIDVPDTLEFGDDGDFTLPTEEGVCFVIVKADCPPSKECNCFFSQPERVRPTSCGCCNCEVLATMRFPGKASDLAELLKDDWPFRTVEDHVAARRAFLADQVNLIADQVNV